MCVTHTKTLEENAIKVLREVYRTPEFSYIQTLFSGEKTYSEPMPIDMLYRLNHH